MPYVNYLFCERCGPPARLDIDYIETINAYIADGRKRAVIDDRVLIWDYLMYRCGICRSNFRYTYREVEQLVRQYFATLATQLHRDYVNSVSEAQAEEEDRKAGSFFVDQQAKTQKRLKEMYEKN